MTKEEFAKEAALALESLPEEFIKMISNVEIVVSDERSGKGSSMLLGLYQGVPLDSRDTYYSALPDKITLYRKNIEELCSTDAEIKSEIRRTIIHEIAHHFGMDEKRVRKAGY